MIDTTHRSQELEIMDDLDMSGEMLITSLDQLETINKWLGGNKLTLDGIQKILDGKSKDREYSIVDLGCGHGDMLRKIADYGKDNGYTFKLLGVDANQATIDYGKSLSKKYENIRYAKQDVIADTLPADSYDIALSTLFLHHFEDEVAVELIKRLLNKTTIGIVVNDLHRHPVPYYLFKMLTTVFGNEMVKADGLTSITKAFKRVDLERFAKEVGYNSSIQWRWAFRYQWIIKK